MGTALCRSVVYLPATAPPHPNMLDFFARRFPRIPVETWASRIVEGKIVNEENVPITLHTAYRPDSRLFYHRETVEEKTIPFQEHILFQDDHLLVACKPPFLPVTPSGPYVGETLLNRLMARTGNTLLSPINRIDRETSGLVLLSTSKESRGAYQRLFMEGKVRKIYTAVTSFPHHPGQSEWLVENRLEEGEPWFVMRPCRGPVNAVSRIRFIENRGTRALFELQPLTGKKHQLRLHLSGLGYPILHDRCYPRLQEKSEDDFGRPLQLLARQLMFKDPISGEQRAFATTRQLSSWQVDDDQPAPESSSAAAAF